MQDDKLVAVYATCVTNRKEQNFCNTMSKWGKGLWVAEMNEKEVLIAVKEANYSNGLVKQVRRTLKILRKIPSKIVSISQQAETGCEWCDNTSLSVDISFGRTSRQDFYEGFPCCGGGRYHEEDSFKRQSEWFICGKCDGG